MRALKSCVVVTLTQIKRKGADDQSIPSSNNQKNIVKC